MISQEDIEAFKAMEAGEPASAPPLSVEDFDGRAMSGDNLSRYFKNYVPCSLSLDELIDQAFSY